MSKSNKANEDILNSLHHMTAEVIARMFKEAQGEPELMLKVIREARGFLKDNNVSADITNNRPLQEIEGNVKVAELPFEVEADEE